LRTTSRRDLLPWRRADGLKQFYLYWIPVDRFPVAAGQRLWLLNFFESFSERLKSNYGLRPHVFIQMKFLQGALKDLFFQTVGDFSPIIGLGRKPGSDLPCLPTSEDIIAIQEGRKRFDFNEFTADYCYWFREKSDKKQCELFLGAGGLTIEFIRNEEVAKLPEFKISPRLREHPQFRSVLQNFDPDRTRARSSALLEGFLAKSKQLFGAGLEHHPQFRGILFIVPLLSAGNFLELAAEEFDKWFQLFDVYINESPTDRGIVLATKDDMESEMITLVEKMRGEGLVYSEGL
jgi:hypothetical protein